MTARPLPEAERVAFEAWIRKEYGADVTWESGEDSPAFAPLPQYADTVDPEETRNEREERSLWEEWSAWKARAAIAAAMAPGEPVAWQIVDVRTGPTGYFGVTEDDAWDRMVEATRCSRNEWDGERHARPLHPAPPAPPVAESHRAEVARAVAEERARCMADCDTVKERIPADAHDETAYAFRGGADACRAAIRARGGA